MSDQIKAALEAAKVELIPMVELPGTFTEHGIKHLKGTIQQIEDAIKKIDTIYEMGAAADKILCAACGHRIEKVGTKWHHTESAPIEYSESPTNKGQPHADIKYRELCYHCPCITPTLPSVRTVCPVG